MKATGIVRRIDDLGRIVIPKEIRRTLRIRETDPLEIFTDREGEIILKKYSPIGELGAFAKEYAESLAQTTGHTVCVSDRDQIIAAAGPDKKDMIKKNITKKMEQLLEKVRLLHIQNDFKNNGGEDKYFRMALLMEELGEICDALTKQKPNFKEEHADLLILLLGNCVAYDIDIIKLTSEKLDRLLKMKARTDGNGHSRLITELEEKE
mgnify:FL=1